jgi:hypothetical protein
MATAAAAAVARARREIQHHFFSQDAVRPDRAVAFEPGTLIERRQFERLCTRGVIHEEKPGLYWLDVVAYDTDLRERFGRVRLALLTVVLALMVGLVAALVAR